MEKEKRSDVGKGKPPMDKRFSKENQPSEENRKKGRIKAQFKRDVIKQMLNLPYKFAPDSNIKTQLINSFGKGILEMSVGEVMTLQQMQRAILKGDTYAFNSILDQGLGRQTQKISNVDADTGETVKQTFIIGGKVIEF